MSAAPRAARHSGLLEPSRARCAPSGPRNTRSAAARGKKLVFQFVGILGCALLQFGAEGPLAGQVPRAGAGGGGGRQRSVAGGDGGRNAAGKNVRSRQAGRRRRADPAQRKAQHRVFELKSKTKAKQRTTTRTPPSLKQAKMAQNLAKWQRGRRAGCSSGATCYSHKQQGERPLTDQAKQSQLRAAVTWRSLSLLHP